MPAIEIEYFNAETPVHRLHPFTKMIFEVAIFVIAMVFNAPLYLIALGFGVAAIAAIARVPMRKFRYMWVVFYVALFFIATQGVWFTSFGAFGDVENTFVWHTLFHVWPTWVPGGPRIPFVLEGAIFGLALGLRLMVISLAFPIPIMTTHPSDLVASLAQIRVGSWRLPYNFIFAFASALRFIPTVSREFDNTLDAQRARGVEFEGYNIARRIRATVPLMVPVLTSSLVHAHDLTLALETRAFGAETTPTIIREVKWQTVDWVVSIALILITIGCVVAARQYGLGVLPYTPQLGA